MLSLVDKNTTWLRRFRHSTPSLSSGGTQVVYGGGFADGALVHGTEFVSSGGSDRSSQVYSGGVEDVGSDGISYSANILEGAT